MVCKHSRIYVFWVHRGSSLLWSLVIVECVTFEINSHDKRFRPERRAGHVEVTGVIHAHPAVLAFMFIVHGLQHAQSLSIFYPNLPTRALAFSFTNTYFISKYFQLTLMFCSPNRPRQRSAFLSPENRIHLVQTCGFVTTPLSTCEHQLERHVHSVSYTHLTLPTICSV